MPFFVTIGANLLIFIGLLNRILPALSIRNTEKSIGYRMHADNPFLAWNMHIDINRER